VLALGICAVALAACRGRTHPATLSARLPRVTLAPPTDAAPARPGDRCAFDWISLDEAFRACPVFDHEEEHPWNRRVRVSPEAPTVRSGESLRLVVGLGNRGRGPWSADLDDRCGVAMVPLLLDASGQPLDDGAFLPAPSCPPTRARVTLSGRGEVTSTILFKAVRRTHERVVVGRKTLPGGKMEPLFETRLKESPLEPGPYDVELLLPTTDGASEIIRVTVTRARG
jgi:hypothetical protein